MLVNALGLFAENLGDLARARKALRRARDLSRSGSMRYQNLAHVELFAGRFRQALEYTEEAVSFALEAKNDGSTSSALCYRAISHFALGDITAAAADFHRATELVGVALRSFGCIQEAEYKLLLGDRPGALIQAQANGEFATGNNYKSLLCQCNPSSPDSYYRTIQPKLPNTLRKPVHSPATPA